VMKKLDRPTRLIAYDTDINIRRRQEGKAPVFNLLRARTVLYAVIIAVVGGVMLTALASRNPTGISVNHDRNPMYVRLADGSLRNAYTVRLLNKELQPQTFQLSVGGLPDLQVSVIGGDPAGHGVHEITVGPDQTREVRVLVTAKAPLPAQSVPLDFTIVDLASGSRATVSDYFHGP
jgi:polyferredoxin